MVDLNFPNAISDPRDFYGRKAELEQVESVLASRARIPVLILGERRIGKTSLQNVVNARLQDVEGAEFRQFVPVIVQPRGLDTLNGFALAVFARLGIHLKKGLRETGLLDSRDQFRLDTIEQFETGFLRLLPPDNTQHFLLCVDEFDEIVRSAPQDELARIMGLVHSLVEKTDLPLTLFFTMTRLPESLRDQRPSPLVSKSQPVELAPFNRVELGEMVWGILRDQYQWSESGIDWLYQVSGGHPYFAKLLLDHLLKKIVLNGTWLPDDQTVLMSALRAALNDPRANHAIENLYRAQFSDVEKELILLLAVRQGSVSRQELLQAGRPWITAARRLVKRHYLRQFQDRFSFHITFLGYWLENWIEFDEELDRFFTLRDRLLEPVEIQVLEATRQVIVRGQTVHVSPQEYSIMRLLACNAGELVEREQLIQEVWETEQGVTDQTVDTAFYRLRKKLDDDGKYIKTIPGQGFVLHRAVLISAE